MSTLTETEEAAAPVAAPGSFFAKTATPTEWRLIAAAIKHMTEEATFRVGPAGLQFASMSTDKMTELVVDWPAKAFHKYACPEDTSLTVVVDQFQKALARAGADDAVEMTTTDVGLLKVSFRGTEPKDFELHLIGEKDAPKVPTNLGASTLLFAPGVLDEALGDIGVVSNEFWLEANAAGVLFTGGDVDSGNARTNLAKGHEGLLKLEPAPGRQRACYSIEQVEPVLRALHGAQSVEVLFGTGKPLRLQFRLNDAGATCTFFTGPRHVSAPAGEAPPKAKAAPKGAEEVPEPPEEPAS